MSIITHTNTLKMFSSWELFTYAVVTFFVLLSIMIAKAYTDILFQDVLSKWQDGWTILLERIYEISLRYEWIKEGEGMWKEAGEKNIRIILINKTDSPQGKTWLLVKVSAGRKVEAKVNTPVSSTAEKYSSIRLHPGTQERNLGASSDSPFRSLSSKVPLVVLLF